MFNIHSTELLLVCVVALIVIGPEKLPGAIKTASLWIGRFRRSFYKVKNEIERELNADEIRRQLHNESVLDDIENAKSRMSDLAKETERSVNNLVNSDTFDPGAASAVKADDAEQEAPQTEEKTLVAEITEAGEQIQEVHEEIKEQLYGSGKNPKLAGKIDDSKVESNDNS